MFRIKAALLSCLQLPCLFLFSMGDVVAAQATHQRILHHIDVTQTFRLAGHIRPAVALAQDIGPVPDSETLSGLSVHFSLTPAQQADLARLQSQLQDPSSQQFHKFLTPEQYAERFGLSIADLERLTRWLEQNGFSNIEVARSRTWIHFSGTAGQLQAAFQTALHRYSLGGQLHFANSADPTLPKALDGVVSGLGGLHDFRWKQRAHVRPMFTSGTGEHALTPEDFATIFDVTGLYGQGFDGTGVKIAIPAESNVDLADVRKFRSVFGLPANDPQVVLAGTDPGIKKGDEQESEIDLELAGAVAKNATLLLVVADATSKGGVFDALAYAIDHNLAPIVSLSYGGCEQDLSASDYASLSNLLAQATTQGMTILASSGDSGPATCDTTYPATHGMAVDYPADSPYVTGVGGTAFNADLGNNASAYWRFGSDPSYGSALTYIGESAWNEPDKNGTHLLASGGGASTFASKPAWQTGVGVPNDRARDVPDVAYPASVQHDPWLVCTAGSCVNGPVDANGYIAVAGGTSLAAPVMAGIVALLVQKTGESQGNINPRLYAIAAASPAAFHDVTVGSNIIQCDPQSSGCPSGSFGYDATPGYDQVTGLGSVDALNLANAWPDFGISAAPTTLAVQRGSVGTVAVSVSHVNGFNDPVTLTCSVAAPLTNVTCSVPSTPTTAGSAALTITAGTAASASLLFPFDPRIPVGAVLLVGALLLYGQRQRRMSLAGAFACTLLVVATVGTSSCGSGSASGVTVTAAVRTPPQTGTITVTATSGQASRSANVTVTVQ